VVLYSVKPLPRQLGQKYGSRFPAIRDAILSMDPEMAARTLLSGQALKVTVSGETYHILPDEVEVRADARAGFAVASEGAYLAALVTDLTPELIREGLAREFVRRVQDLRKQAELEVADRIKLYVQASPGLKDAIEAHREYITGETLTVHLAFEAPPGSAVQTSDQFDGETVTIGLIKA
jgi:isoleucyl-tRNA synthetase